MKTLSRTCAVVILSLTLALSALAGTIHSPGYVPPPPPPSEETSTSVPPSSTDITTTIILTIISLVP